MHSLYSHSHTNPRMAPGDLTVFYFNLSRSYAIISHGFSFVLLGNILLGFDTS